MDEDKKALPACVDRELLIVMTGDDSKDIMIGPTRRYDMSS
jgi:hypothetical protein